MKIIFKILSLIVLFTNCTSKQKRDSISIINDSIEAYIIKNANDPSSYESVETSIIDTITHLENLNKQLEFSKSAADQFEDKYGKGFRENYLDQVDYFSKIKDSLLSSPNPDIAAAYIVVHKYRAKNGYGALMLTESVFEFVPSLEIYHVYDKGTGKSKGYPGGLLKSAIICSGDIQSNKTSFFNNEPIIISYSIKNTSDHAVNIWHCGVWCNYKIKATSNEGIAVPLTSYGKSAIGAFDPGGQRDKNYPVRLAPKEIDSQFKKHDLREIFDFKNSGKYSVQYFYHEIEMGRIEVKAESNKLSFEIKE